MPLNNLQVNEPKKKNYINDQPEQVSMLFGGGRGGSKGERNWNEALG